ncbi:MAG: hypothetical protein VX920_00790 [Pseudomonadota bacterium]|nr:hypothetical protein [Pseudomonadota bacterium]
MKAFLRNVFSPILNPFESGDDSYVYRPSHRKILLVVGVLFLVLATGALAATLVAELYGGLIPVAVFLVVGLVCEVVGLLGTDKAVARMWKSK